MSDSAPAPSWAPGYNTSALFRQGDRARIVRATRTTSGAEVVLKVLPAEAGRVELDRLRELSGVSGIVPLLDAGFTTKGDVFVVFPYYHDGSFADMLSRVGPAPIQEAAAVARSIAAVLSAVHAQGLTHNDVSPGNVLRAGRTPVLTGFGSVHRTGDPLPPPTATTEAFLHSPPEALHGDPRTPTSDVYQLASTIWTMLVGHAPFSIIGDPFDPHAYANRVFHEPPPPISRQDVSRKLRGVLNRALSKYPEERYANTAEFSAAFEQARLARPATIVSEGTEANAPRTGTQVPPTRAPSFPLTSSEPQRPLSGPQGHPRPRLENASRLLPPERELPSPQERADHGAAPENSPNSTADIAMARLRGEEISPLVTWSRLEGWTGETEDSYLPADEVSQEGESEPRWDTPDLEDQKQPRWREHLHIAVTVCGVLLVTVVASAFAATRSPEPVVAAVEPEEDEAEQLVEETAASLEPVVEPSPLPEVSPPSEVVLQDTLSAITLSWTDNTGGTGSYFVVGGLQGHDSTTLARTGPGALTAQINTENTQAEYCFTVVAVDGGASTSDEVCTTRAVERAAEAERLAEEEAAAEEEEEEEESEGAPALSPSPNTDD